MCVDWDTIVVYTCSNITKCVPNFAKGENYLEEFAFVQFSKDFSKVKYGTPDQINAQKAKQPRNQKIEETDETDPDVIEAKRLEEQRAQKKADKNKKRKEKKKQKQAEMKQNSQQVNA
jgi:hypothetical protein